MSRLFRVPKEEIDERRQKKAFPTGWKTIFGDQSDFSARPDLEDEAAGIYITYFTPVGTILKHIYLKRYSRLYGYIEGTDAWTNGFIVFYNYRTLPENCIIRFPDYKKLFNPVHRVERVCLLSYKNSYSVTYAAVQASGRTVFFSLREFDIMISGFKSKGVGFKVYCDENFHGVMSYYNDSPIMYLCRLKFPSIIEPIFVSRVERYYENSRG